MLLVRSTPDSFPPTFAGRPLAFRFIGFGCDVRCCLGGCSPSLFDLFIMSLRVCSDATTSFGAVVAEGTHDTKPAGLLTGQVSRVPLSQHLLPRHSTLIFVKLDRPTGYFARQGARTEWLQGDHCLCVKPSMLVLAPPMASCRCPRRVLLGLLRPQAARVPRATSTTSTLPSRPLELQVQVHPPSSPFDDPMDDHLI